MATRPIRALVVWWYSPANEKWVKWRQDVGPFSAGDAMLRASESAAWLPPGRTFIDQWVRRGGKWAHETRYRFGTEV